MDYEQIKTFLSIVETESISETANSLDVSQSTISNRLRSLEEELNTILFSRGRGKRGTKITENGKSFIPLAQAWLDLYLRTGNWVTSSIENTVIIGSLETLNTCVFAPFYEQFAGKSQKQIKLQIRTRVASTLYEMLKYHEIDFGLTVHAIFYPTIDLVPLFSEDYVAVVPKGWPLDAQKLVNLKELALSSEILLPWDQYFLAWHEEQIGLVRDSCISVDLLPLAIRYMTSPERWMIAPYSAAKTISELTGKKLAFLEQSPPVRTCYLITHKQPIYDKIQSINYVLDELLRYIGTLDNIILPTHAAKDRYTGE